MNITNKYKLPTLCKKNKTSEVDRFILVHGIKVEPPYQTDLESIQEYHYIIKDWGELHRVPFGVRRYPGGEYVGYLELFNRKTLVEPCQAHTELPNSVKDAIVQHVNNSINQGMVNIYRYKRFIRFIK
jgi:hypothetical protein